MSDPASDAIRQEQREREEYKRKYDELKEEKIKEIRERYREILPEEISTKFIDKCVEVYTSLPMFSNPYLFNLRDDSLLFVASFVILSELQYKKEGTYGRSWNKRNDEREIFFNLARKFDRLENMVLKDNVDEVGEGRIDTVGDSANYGNLWMTYYIREYPDEFLKWAKNYSSLV